jgi:hypothetical protein
MELRKAQIDTVEQDQPTETEVEGEIRELVRRDVVTDLMRQPENENEMAASSINSMLQRATATSTQEIDTLITEMETLRETLHSEATRVQREVFQYATLTQEALQSSKIIAESLTQFGCRPRRSAQMAA